MTGLASTSGMWTPRAVIFDFFGTLVPGLSLAAYKRVLREMAAVVGAPPDDFIRQWMGTTERRMTGQIPSVQANVAAICAALAVSVDPADCEEAAALRYAYAQTYVVPRPSAISTLQAIKARGLKLGLVSDCSGELPQLWPDTPFSPWFDVTVFSCVVKVKKPNAEIYRLAATRLGVACSECLYVGDGGSHELDGAKEVGMHPVLLFDANEQNNPDMHRINEQTWDGPRVADLAEVLTLIPNSSPASR